MAPTERPGWHCKIRRAAGKLAAATPVSFSSIFFHYAFLTFTDPHWTTTGLNQWLLLYTILKQSSHFLTTIVAPKRRILFCFFWASPELNQFIFSLRIKDSADRFPMFSWSSYTTSSLLFFTRHCAGHRSIMASRARLKAHAHTHKHTA